MALRRKKKSRTEQIADLAIDYLKIKAASKAVKGAGKGARKAAKGTAVYTAAKKSSFRSRPHSRCGRERRVLWPRRAWRPSTARPRATA
jgi:hypothetical protein